MEDYKEKYEQAMLRMSKWVEGSEITYPKEVAEFVFPELKESEDERTRKEIIRYLKVTSPAMGENIEKMLAWLEKQGEQKTVLDNTLKEAFNRSRKDYSLEEKKEASDYSESIIPTSIAYGESEEEYMLHKIIEAAFIAGQNIKQKSAWSEEDEKIIDEAISLINMLASGYGEKVTEPITFNGVKMINNVKENLRNLHKKLNHWKPSDEQMKALWDSIPENVKEISEREMLLDSLYQDLKKLRKE